MRMLNPDGSISIMDLTYHEAQRICKMLGLRATGKSALSRDTCKIVPHLPLSFALTEFQVL